MVFCKIQFFHTSLFIQKCTCSFILLVLTFQIRHHMQFSKINWPILKCTNLIRIFLICVLRVCGEPVLLSFPFFLNLYKSNIFFFSDKDDNGAHCRIKMLQVQTKNSRVPLMHSMLLFVQNNQFQTKCPWLI